MGHAICLRHGTLSLNFLTWLFKNLSRCVYSLYATLYNKLTTVAADVMMTLHMEHATFTKTHSKAITPPIHQK